MTHHARHHVSHPRAGTALRVAQGLAWLGLGFGALAVMAPRGLARALGMRGSEPLIRACGARELVTGTGVLLSRRPAPWMWGRVAGDVLDLVALAPAYTDRNLRKRNVGLALLGVAGLTTLDALCARALSAGSTRPRTARRDYSDRSGFPEPPEAMRGMARAVRSRGVSPAREPSPAHRGSSAASAAVRGVD